MIDRTSIEAAIQAPAAVLASLAAERLDEGLRQQVIRAGGEAANTLDSTLRRATIGRGTLTRSVQIVTLSTPPAPPILASMLYPPEGAPLPLGVAQGPAGTMAQAQADAAARTVKPADRAPVTSPVMLDAAPAILVTQRVGTGATAGTHVLVLDAAAFAKPALEPIALGGSSVVLTGKDGKPLLKTGADGVTATAVAPVPFGGNAMNVAVGLAVPPSVEAQFAMPEPDRLPSTLFAIVTGLGLLVAIVAVLQRGKRSE